MWCRDCCCALLLWLVAATSAEETPKLSVNGRCAVLRPSGDVSGLSDLLAFRAASVALPDSGGCVEFSRGKYHFDSSPFLSTGGQDPSPQCGGRWDCTDAIVHIHGRRDVVIRGPRSGDAELLITNYDKARGDQARTSVIFAENCTNFRVHNLAIRHADADVNHLVGVVTGVLEGSSTLRVVVPAQFLPLRRAVYEHDGETVRAVGCTGSESVVQSDVFHAEHFIRLDAELRVTGSDFFVERPNSGRSYDAWLDPDQGECNGAKECKVVLLRFFQPDTERCRVVDAFASNFVVGDRLLAIHQKRAVWGVSFLDVDGLQLTNLTFGNLAGPSIAGSRVRNIQVVNQKTVRPAVGWRTVNDALWVRGYSGGENLVRGLELERLTDDYFNFHTLFAQMLPATAIARDGAGSGTTCIATGLWWFWDSNWVHSGESVTLYSDRKERLWRGVYRSSIRDVSTGTWLACFADHDGQLGALAADVHLASADKWLPEYKSDGSPSLTITGVQVSNSRARGMIKGSNTLVDGLKVEDNMMAGLVIGSAEDMEGTPAASVCVNAVNVTIRNVEMARVALHDEFPAAIVVGSTSVSWRRREEDEYGLVGDAQLHHSVSVENATITGMSPGNPALLAVGVCDLSLQGLRVERTHDLIFRNTEISKAPALSYAAGGPWTGRDVASFEGSAAERPSVSMLLWAPLTVVLIEIVLIVD